MMLALRQKGLKCWKAKSYISMPRAVNSDLGERIDTGETRVTSLLFVISRTNLEWILSCLNFWLSMWK